MNMINILFAEAMVAAVEEMEYTNSISSSIEEEIVEIVDDIYDILIEKEARASRRRNSKKHEKHLSREEKLAKAYVKSAKDYNSNVAIRREKEEDYLLRDIEEQMVDWEAEFTLMPQLDQNLASQPDYVYWLYSQGRVDKLSAILELRNCIDMVWADWSTLVERAMLITTKDEHNALMALNRFVNKCNNYIALIKNA